MKTKLEYYSFISEWYGDTVASRSGVPYMNHIDEGIIILNAIGASDDAIKAYCVHPIFQTPGALRGIFNSTDLNNIEPRVIMLAMEYRNKANSYLCRPQTDNYVLEDLPYMVMLEVTHMLIADKVQNYKDFLLYHQDHERFEQLDNYFNMWFEHLEVDFKKLVKKLG